MRVNCLHVYASIHFMLTIYNCSPIGLPTLTGRVDVPIWPSTSHAADARVTHTSVHPAPYLASYNVYSIGASGWLASENSDLLPVLGGVGVLLGIIVYLVYTVTRRHSQHAVCSL